MLTIVQKWGNSLGIHIPRQIAKQIAVDQGSEVDLIVSDDYTLIVIPRKKKTDIGTIVGPMQAGKSA